MRRSDRSGGETKRERLVSGTKGSHLIIDNDDLADALGGHMVYFENSDGRVCIVFPVSSARFWPGSTDIRVKSASQSALRMTTSYSLYPRTRLGWCFPDIACLGAEAMSSSAIQGIRPLAEKRP